MRMMSVVAASVAVAASLVMAPAAPGQGGGQRTGRIDVGEPFPDVVLPDLDGAPRSLAELRGQKVVLHVFASW